MKVYKFGGASVKDAEGVENLLQVLQKTDFQKGVVVVSAMGKNTNALEVLVKEYIEKKDYSTSLESIKSFHYDMAKTLFPDFHPVFDDLSKRFQNLEEFLEYNKSEEYNFVYDQIVSYGELLSTTIVYNYLNFKGINCQFLDSRTCIKTDNSYREGKVDWKKTEQNIQKLLEETLYVTQGFIASDENNFNVTLGREGSDYSAAIFAYCLNADSMTIWKDVAGVMNADPRYFQNTVLLNQISYQEAVEMAFYGASVIHPKTLKPLENKEIPFFVKSFISPENAGTKITKGSAIEPYVPCFIKKDNQHLIKISPLDFSFVSEYHMSEIFDYLSQHKIKISMLQISAISLNLCLEDKYNRIPNFLEEIEKEFSISYHKDCALLTVRHFNEESKKELLEDKKLLLEQIVEETLQIVVE